MARDDLTAEERERHARGVCIVDEVELPKLADGNPAPDRLYCSPRCRAKRYRARKRSGKTRTSSELRARQAADRMLRRRADLVDELDRLLEEIRELEGEIQRKAVRGGFAAPELHRRRGSLPAHPPDARELEAAGQLRIEPGKGHPGAVDPEIVARVAAELEAAGPDGARALELAARLRLTLAPVERSLAVLSVERRARARADTRGPGHPVTVWSSTTPKAAK